MKVERISFVQEPDGCWRWERKKNKGKAAAVGQGPEFESREDCVRDAKMANPDLPPDCFEWPEDDG